MKNLIKKIEIFNIKKIKLIYIYRLFLLLTKQKWKMCSRIVYNCYFDTYSDQSDIYKEPIMPEIEIKIWIWLTARFRIRSVFSTNSPAHTLHTTQSAKLTSVTKSINYCLPAIAGIERLLAAWTTTLLITISFYFIRTQISALKWKRICGQII